MGIRSSSAPFDDYGFELVKKDLERLSLKQYQILYDPNAAYSQGTNGGGVFDVPGHLVPNGFVIEEKDVCIDGIPFKQDFIVGPARPVT